MAVDREVPDSLVQEARGLVVLVGVYTVVRADVVREGVVGSVEPSEGRRDGVYEVSYGIANPRVSRLYE